MSIQALSWCVHQRCPTPTCKLVLFVLSNYADERHTCFPSEQHIATICGVSSRSVRRCLKSLSDAGLIFIELRKGTSSRYHLGVDASVHTRADASDRTVRTRTTAYTKDTQKTKTTRSLNELAG